MATVVPIRAPRGKLLTLSEVCDELQIALSTFYDWKGKGAAPRCIKLPNGKLRIRRTDLDAWINAREVAA